MGIWCSTNRINKQFISALTFDSNIFLDLKPESAIDYVINKSTINDYFEQRPESQQQRELQIGRFHTIILLKSKRCSGVDDMIEKNLRSELLVEELYTRISVHSKEIFRVDWTMDKCAVNEQFTGTGAGRFSSNVWLQHLINIKQMNHSYRE